MADDRFGSFGGGSQGPAGPGGPKDNPSAGIRRDASEFGGSKLFIPGGFQTRQSKVNDASWDDDDMGGPGSMKKSLPPDEDVPF